MNTRLLITPASILPGRVLSVKVAANFLKFNGLVTCVKCRR